jgi:membrane protease YdiL (CAAX protease family)
MYIKQVFKVENDWWLYLIGVIIVGISTVIGSIPHTIALFSVAFSENTDMSSIQEDPYALMSLIDSNLNLFLMLLSFAIGLLALLFVVKFIHKQTINSLTTSRKKIDWSRFWFSFILWGFVTVIFIVIEFLSSPENYVLNFDLIPFLVLFSIAVIMVPLQTSFEEYLFRGYLMQGLGVLSKNRWVPLFITSIAFGLLHIANPEIEKIGYILLIHYIGTGFLLGIMTLMDEGLELALGFHAANNLIASLLLTADWTAFQTNSILKDVSDPSMGNLEIIFPVFVIYPIILFVLSKKYNWTNWQKKLFGIVKND